MKQAPSRRKRARAPAVPALRPSTVASTTPRATSPAAVYVASLAPGSRRAQAAALVKIARLLGKENPESVPWGELTPAHVDALRVLLVDGGADGIQGAPATVNRHLAALKGTLRAAWRAGEMDAATYLACKDVRGVKGSRLPRGRAIEPEEWRRLFKEIDQEETPTRERDAALIALCYAGGFRRAELTALDLADYERESSRLRIVGKGNVERFVFINNGARDALHAWLRVRGSEPGPLLLPVNRHGQIIMRRLSEQTIYDRCKYLAERAGVKTFSPHDCRRSLAGDLLDAGVDLAVVQRVLGHASPVPAVNV